MINTSFRFMHKFLLSARSSQSHAALCLNLMSHHRVNNKPNRVKGRRWRWLIYALRNFLLRNNVTCYQKQPPLPLKVSQIPQENTCVGVFFFLKMTKLFKDISSYYRFTAILRRTLLWIFGKWFMKTSGKEKHSLHNTHIYIYRSQTFWSFMKFYFVHIVKVFCL